MIPLLLIAGGAYLVGNAMQIKKLSMGDYLKEKTIEDGDEVVFEFKDDSWLEMYEDEEFPTSEIAFQSGEEFEVVVFAQDPSHYHVKFPDDSVAFIPKDEVIIVAVNDEVASFKKGGKVRNLFAESVIKKDGKYYVTIIDFDDNDKLVKRKKFDKLEDAQVYRLNYNSPDEKIGSVTENGYDVMNIKGEKAYVGEYEYNVYNDKGTKYVGYFANDDDSPLAFGPTKEDVIDALEFRATDTYLKSLK